MYYDISQGHGAEAYTDTYFRGTQFRGRGGWVGGEGTKFGKFSNFNTIYTKN